MPDTYLTTTEAAVRLGYHRGSVQLLCKKRRLRAIKLARLWFISAEAVEQYLRYRDDPRDSRRPRGDYKHGK